MKTLTRRSVYSLPFIGFLLGRTLAPGDGATALARDEGAGQTDLARAFRELTERVRVLDAGRLEQAESLSKLSRTSPPLGTILPFAGPNEPDNWLFCDGRELDLTKTPDYKGLADLIKATYDPEHKVVKLPNLRGRVPIGAGPKAGALSERSLGSIGGNETHILTIAEMPIHSHGITDPGHAHRVPTEKDEGNFMPRGGANGHIPGNRLTDPQTTGITVNTEGGGNAHNNMQPFTVINYIIKYK
jgi:microcystin-dependent protein